MRAVRALASLCICVFIAKQCNISTKISCVDFYLLYSVILGGLARIPGDDVVDDSEKQINA